MRCLAPHKQFSEMPSSLTGITNPLIAVDGEEYLILKCGGFRIKLKKRQHQLPLAVDEIRQDVIHRVPVGRDFIKGTDAIMVSSLGPLAIRKTSHIAFGIRLRRIK